MVSIMSNRIRRIAVFIDGGFFLKRLPHLHIPDDFRDTSKSVAKTAYELCKRHVLRIIGGQHEQDGRWLDHAYRFFYYDALPYEGQVHHPLTDRLIRYAHSPEASFRRELFNNLRRMRKFAVRLGHVDKAGGWRIKDRRKLKSLLKTSQIAHILSEIAEGRAVEALSSQDRELLRQLAQEWQGLREEDLLFDLRQKGVDMRLGVDITSIVLKKQADTLVIVTGDSDFVPVAKLARREGAEVILDPLWQGVQPGLHEHIDGLYSVIGADKGQQQNSAP